MDLLLFMLAMLPGLAKERTDPAKRDAQYHRIWELRGKGSAHHQAIQIALRTSS
jgi:hypothetical protein